MEAPHGSLFHPQQKFMIVFQSTVATPSTINNYWQGFTFTISGSEQISANKEVIGQRSNPFKADNGLSPILQTGKELLHDPLFTPAILLQ